MYMIGAPHPNKDRAAALVSQLVRDGESLVTDVEVYQELLHRYSGIRRFDSLDDALATLDSITDEVLSFGLPEVRLARALIESVQGISARDAIHVAVMYRAGITEVLSFDRGFDNCPGITRLD
jgi:predicted nucleic acid-binding protein